MARNTYVETRLDFAAIGDDLAAIEPPTITLRQVLERLKPQLELLQKRGVTYEQMRDTLKKHRIDAPAKALRDLLDGREDAGKTRPPARQRSERHSATTAPTAGDATPATPESG